MEKAVISKNLINDAIFAVTHLYLLEDLPSLLFIHLEPRFCPFSRFRFVAAVYNESEISLPRLRLKFTFLKPETTKLDNLPDEVPASVSSTLTLPRDIAAGDCVAESLPSRFSELPLIVSVSLSLHHAKVDPMEASELLNEEVLTVCFTSFDVLLDRKQVDEFIEKDDCYDVFDDDVFIPSTTATIKISAQNAVDITETPFNKLTVAHIRQSLFPNVTTSTPSTFSGFVVVKQSFHRILVEIGKVIKYRRRSKS
uniref:PEX-1N domain-containing protein n=1 Tax=Panagrellus redivivus TaxID=6233 RepID=A0A7E4VES5_PANRE